MISSVGNKQNKERRWLLSVLKAITWQQYPEQVLRAAFVFKHDECFAEISDFIAKYLFQADVEEPQMNPFEADDVLSRSWGKSWPSIAHVSR